MEIVAYKPEESKQMIETFESYVFEDAIRHVKHIYNITHNRLTKEINQIVGCHRTDSSIESITADVNKFADKLVELLDSETPYTQPTDKLLSVLRQAIVGKEDSTIESQIVDLILRKLESHLLHISANVGDLAVDVDDISEDWNEVKHVLRNNQIEAFVLSEMDKFSVSLMNSLYSKSIKVEIHQLEKCKACIISILYHVPLIYYTAFGLRKYNKPSIVHLKPGNQPDYSIIAGIASEFGLAYFKLFTDNPNRSDGCVTVFINKVTSDIILYV